jgi:hypothetical protein
MLDNALLVDFHDAIRSRYPKDGDRMTTSQWLSENTHLGGKKFSFSDYAFQVAIADDMSTAMAVIKPSQVGLTTIQLRKAFSFAARNRGTSTIFTLPNEKMYKRISKTQIKPLVNGEKAFAAIGDERASNSMDLYEVAGSFVYVTGMTEGDATSIAADMLAHDEVDLSNQKMIGLFQSRIQNSSWRITHKFSTPTLPGYGIDAAYRVSDQHEYMCVCRSCNHWQVPLFVPDALHLEGLGRIEKLAEITEDQIGLINFDYSYVKCVKCGSPLDLLNPLDREWVAKYPTRKSRGYRVRPFMTKSLMLPYLFQQLTQMRTLDNLKGWYNTVLGEPFSDGSNQLTDEMIQACLKNPGTPDVGQAPCAIGIDVGLICHLTVGAISGDVVHPILFETVPVQDLHERLAALLKQFNIVAGAIDRLPYTPTADAVFADSEKKIIPTQYTGSATINLKVDEFKNISHTQINRTQAIDRLVKVIRNKQILINGYGTHKEVLIEHLKDMVRVETPEVEASWEKINGNDHFFHALALLQIAPRIFQVVAASQMVESETRVMSGIIGVSPKSERSTFMPYNTRSDSAQRSLF